MIFDDFSVFFQCPTISLQTFFLEQRHFFFSDRKLEATDSPETQIFNCNTPKIKWESCLLGCLYLPTNLELHFFLLQYKTSTTPHCHGFFCLKITIHFFLIQNKLFLTCILRKDRFYANPMIRRCSYLGRVSEVDSTIASNSNSKAYVTCE